MATLRFSLTMPSGTLQIEMPFPEDATGAKCELPNGLVFAWRVETTRTQPPVGNAGAGRLPQTKYTQSVKRWLDMKGRPVGQMVSQAYAAFKQDTAQHGTLTQFGLL